MQHNSIQVLFSSDSVSAVRSIILLNIKCLLDLQAVKPPKGDSGKELDQMTEMEENKLRYVCIILLNKVKQFK